MGHASCRVIDVSGLNLGGGASSCRCGVRGLGRGCLLLRRTLLAGPRNCRVLSIHSIASVFARLERATT